MSVQIKCDVCFECYSLDMFRFLPACGHGLCIVCSERTHSKPRCAICRHPKGSLEPVQIYLTFGESTPADKAKSVADNLGRIDADSLPVSVQKAGRKIRHVMRDIQPDDAIARELLDAAKNLDERIYPLFLELDLANDRIAALNAEIQELRRQLTAAESRADEIKQIRRTLAETKVNYKAAVLVAEQTKECVLKEQGQNSRLSRTVQRQLADLETKEQENTQLLAKVTKREKRILLLEKKLKILSRVAKHPKPDADDPDESLQVENFAAGIRVPRKSSDWLEPAHVLRNLQFDADRPAGGGVHSKKRT